jgi:hypothetical protein
MAAFFQCGLRNPLKMKMLYRKYSPAPPKQQSKVCNKWSVSVKNCTGLSMTGNSNWNVFSYRGPLLLLQTFVKSCSKKQKKTSPINHNKRKEVNSVDPNQDLKKMMFYEIGKGKFALAMQAEFEEAQDISIEKNGAVTVTAKITITPPKDNDPDFGDISYQISRTHPAYKSRTFSTEVVNNRIVAEGTNVGDILQIDLFPKDEKIIPMESNS